MALIVGSFALAGGAEGLAWVAADEQVDGFDSFPAGGFEVAVVGDAGPTGGEDSRGVGVNFGVPDDVADAGPFESEREAINTGTNGADAHALITATFIVVLFGLALLCLQSLHFGERRVSELVYRQDFNHGEGVIAH